MCNSCEVLNINGVNCHETGCPESYKTPKDCSWCGHSFIPESRFQSTCSPECFEAYHG
jgi:hypothetical protein